MNESNIPILITAFATIAAPLFLFVQWLLNRKHVIEQEDTSSMAEAVTAITDANVNIAAIVQTLIKPMQEEVKRQAAEEGRLRSELNMVRAAQEAMQTEQEELQRRFTSIIRYVNILRRQILDLDHEPAPLPEDLDLSGFNFD